MSFFDSTTGEAPTAALVVVVADLAVFRGGLPCSDELRAVSAFPSDTPARTDKFCGGVEDGSLLLSTSSSPPDTDSEDSESNSSRF